MGSRILAHAFKTVLIAFAPTLCVTHGVAAVDVRAVVRRLDSLVTCPVPDWKYQMARVEGGERPALDDSGWPVLQPGATEPRRPRWLRKIIRIPDQQGGYNLWGARVTLLLDVGGEAFVYLNGALAYRGADEVIRLNLTEGLRPGDQSLVAIEFVPETTSDSGLDGAILKVMPPSPRPDVHELARTLEVVAALADVEPQSRAQFHGALDAALAKIDFAALDRRDQEEFDASLRSARAILEPLAPELKRYTVQLTGQSHIDMAWLWPWTETVEVVRRTFRTALQLMTRNPEFTFTQSQAAAYAWVEEKYPALFDEIKERVQEGRWEIVGGMWVEPDLNLPDGESLVRQILLGKRYFLEKFGVDVRVGWNPDTFGYNWQMPQILRKSGIEYFVTTKLAFNDTNKFPHRLFWWEAPDGSRVLAYFPNPLGADVDPSPMAAHLAAISAPSGTKEIMFLYGVGDHGGGPTQTNIEAARRLRQMSLFPRVSFSLAQPFLDGLAARAKDLSIPVWNDELYFEYHRGVYTTQAETKRNNRKSEVLLLNAEKFASLAHLRGKPYAHRDLTEAWKLVLFNQFHDILPGSSVAPVYGDAARDYQLARYIGQEVLEDSLAYLGGQVNTQGPGVALIVFNPLSWARSEVVEAKLRLPGESAEFHVTDSQGSFVPHQVVGRDTASKRVKFLFLAEEVPSLGYEVFRVLPGLPKGSVGKPSVISGLKVNAHDLALENEVLRVKVGAQSGLIESIFDKLSRREALDKTRRGNLLQTFVDGPKDWDAWNLDADFENVKWDLDSADSVEVLETGPVRSTVRVIKHFQKSRFVQDIVLYAKVPRVDCDMEVDWREKHILLKVAFPVSVRARDATYEIPFGAIRRPTTRENSIERAKFEVPALRWADLSDESYGVSILNESKYGYDTKGNVIRLSLLRSPAWPDPHADEGAHRFAYSVYPHAGNWERAGTARRGYELNYPLLVRIEPGHEGSLPAQHSFLAIDSPSVFLAALKKAQDDESLVLRLFRLGGGSGETEITLPQTAEGAAETDLMEKDLARLSPEQDRLRVLVKPGEIKTLKIRWSRAG
jgi:alpha-mannosidase